MITAKIVADSVCGRSRLTTFQLRYHRYIHSELMTHRVFSRNAMSSRAVPVKKMLEQVRNEPATPLHWGKNQKGMQAEQELSEEEKATAHHLWLTAAENAADVAEMMMDLGLHKQVTNRILEPFQFISVIVTASEYSNWFALRCHPDAMPEINDLAKKMKVLYDENVPIDRSSNEPYTYHLPYIQENEWNEHSLEMLTKFSVARCARVSYLTHDNEEPSAEQDLKLYDRLTLATPPHLSPLEHQAKGTPYWSDNKYCGNFAPNWIQYRKLFECQMEGRF